MKVFDEKLTKNHIFIGYIMLIMYSFGLLGTIPIIKNIAFFLEILFVVLFLKILWNSIKALKGKIVRSIIWIVLGFVSIFIVQNIVWDSILKNIIMQIIGLEEALNSNQVNLESMLESYPVIFIFGVVFLGPVLEELLYRYICFRSIYEKNKFMAYLVPTVLFGIQHIAIAVIYKGQYNEIINVFSYMIFGFGLTFIYSKTRNLIPSIVIHIINNSIGVLYIFLS